ncbi:MAG: hypothetical protein ACOX42_09420 [Clostridia bacterium]
MTGKGARVASYLLVVTVLAFALYIAGDVFSQEPPPPRRPREIP